MIAAIVLSILLWILVPSAYAVGRARGKVIKSLGPPEHIHVFEEWGDKFIVEKTVNYNEKVRSDVQDRSCTICNLTERRYIKAD